MHLCKTLSQPDPNGLQTCIEWSQYSIFPQLTSDQRDQIILFAVVIFLIVFGVNQLRRLFNS